MNLSAEQQIALDEFGKGKNIFLTGPGGSGKTELIKRMVNMSGTNCQVCALTGCAAILLNCKAKTIHSWSGIGLANGTIEEIVRRVIGNKFKIAQWKKTNVLIIDEVSMMSLKVFEILDTIGKRIRKNPLKPFGGIQLVFAGDFYQLPPVGEDEASTAFCFESDRWASTFDVTVQLKTIFRQTDTVYSDILNQIRIGKLFKSSYEKLKERINKEVPPDTLIKPTILLPRRKDVDLINSNESYKLGDVEKYTYSMTRCVVTPSTPAQGQAKQQGKLQTAQAKPETVENVSESQRDMEYNYLLNNTMADREIIIKKGTQVMCIANIDMECDKPIVNGSQGVVIEFVGGLPMVQFNNGDKRIVGYHNWISEVIPSVAIKQIPLIHAWAITIHKSQGASLDLAKIDVGNNIFECGQTYVALSRIKSIEGLYLTALDPGRIKVNKKVQEFYARYK
jgi:ATP-dependent DNA helicase PIF1